MKFNKIISEQAIQQNKQTLDMDDLANPRLKNILSRIEQEKLRHQKVLENLNKQLEQVKMQNNPVASSGVPGN